MRWYRYVFDQADGFGLRMARIFQRNSGRSMLKLTDTPIFAIHTQDASSLGFTTYTCRSKPMHTPRQLH